MIALQNVTKIYPASTRPALDGVSLDIDKGEFVFLIGASGSGKSSVLRLLLREDTPTKGSVVVNGKDIAKLPGRKVPELRRGIGCVSLGGAIAVSGIGVVLRSRVELQILPRMCTVAMARVDFVRLVSQRAAAKQERQRPSRYDLGKHLALLLLVPPHDNGSLGPPFLFQPHLLGP